MAGNVVTADGVEQLETASRKILRAAIERHRANSVFAWFLGALATLLFWGLLAGPIIALYTAYLHAWSITVKGSQMSWTSFPTPDFAMLAASLVLSIAPGFVLALLGLAWCCSSIRVRRTVAWLKEQHVEMLERHLSSGGLRIDLADPQLEAAKFVLDLCTVATDHQIIKRPYGFADSAFSTPWSTTNV